LGFVACLVLATVVSALVLPRFTGHNITGLINILEYYRVSYGFCVTWASCSVHCAIKQLSDQ